MKLKHDFVVREVAGEYVMIPMGEGALAFSGRVATSEVGAFLCECLREEVSRDQLIGKLLEEYEVDMDTASADVDEFLQTLKKLNLI